MDELLLVTYILDVVFSLLFISCIIGYFVKPLILVLTIPIVLVMIMLFGFTKDIRKYVERKRKLNNIKV